MAKWVNLDDCVEISIGDMNFYPVELLGDVYEEVAPVIHAHWTNKRADIHDGEFYCSHCGIDALWLSDNVQAILNPYCHRCGAKMDEVTK